MPLGTARHKAEKRGAHFNQMSGREMETWSCTGDACMSQKTPSSAMTLSTPTMTLSVMTSHPGWWKTLELVSHNYWWPGISHYVASYVAGGEACTCSRSFLTQKVGKLTPNQIPT